MSQNLLLLYVVEISTYGRGKNQYDKHQRAVSVFVAGVSRHELTHSLLFQPEAIHYIYQDDC